MLSIVLVLGIRITVRLLEKIQHRYTKMIMNLQDKAYEERLRCLKLWTLEERRNRQDSVVVFKMYRGLSNVLLHELFTLDENSKGTRGHSCKLVKTRCTRDITKYFFSHKVINRWNLMDQRMVDTSSINAFKSRLVYIRDNRMGLFMNPRPYWLDDLPLRLHKVTNKANLSNHNFCAIFDVFP